MSSKFSYLIDTEGFFVNGQYHVKELAVYDFVTETSRVYHFRLPYKFNELSFNDKRCVKYVSRNVHGIRFENWSNDLERRMLYLRLEDLIDRSRWMDKLICYKGGHWEKELLSVLGYHDAVNIEQFNCPRYETLCMTNKRSEGCGRHVKNTHKIMHCSKNEVEVFGRWLKKNYVH